MRDPYRNLDLDYITLISALSSTLACRYVSLALISNLEF